MNSTYKAKLLLSSQGIIKFKIQNKIPFAKTESKILLRNPTDDVKYDIFNILSQKGRLKNSHEFRVPDFHLCAKLKVGAKKVIRREKMKWSGVKREQRRKREGKRYKKELRKVKDSEKIKENKTIR